MTTRERIKQKMAEEKVSADTLAVELGVDRSTVFRWLSGKTKRIDADKLADIARVLNTTWSYLVGEENNNALSDAGESAKEAAILVESMNPEKREEGLRYLRYLSKSE